MHFKKFIFLLLTVLTLAGCQSGVRNIPVSANSEFGKKMLELDAIGRARQNAPIYSKALQDFETAHSGNCPDVVFDNLQEPGQRISKYVRLYMIEGRSPTCGIRLYCTRLTFEDPANTVVKRAEILFGPDEELNYRNKAMEFIHYAQAGDVQQMLAITSPLSYATEADSIRTVYVESVIPKFRGTVVSWDANDVPIVDESKNVGLAFVGNAQGTNRFSFDVGVYKEKGKFVIANIRKRH